MSAADRSILHVFLAQVSKVTDEDLREQEGCLRTMLDAVVEERVRRAAARVTEEQRRDDAMARARTFTRCPHGYACACPEGCRTAN